VLTFLIAHNANTEDMCDCLIDVSNVSPQHAA